jgi:ubiquinone/menaquinone biosynthesis C-methylase UbiE
MIIKAPYSLIPTVKNYIRQRLFKRPVIEKNPAEAYDLWSANYDTQPGNLMLDLDEVLFHKLVLKSSIENKSVADIGCGTGRHWNKILQMRPKTLTGFDVSEGMLNKLKEKFPGANAYKITDNLLSVAHTAPYDTIISTLTVAHIENIELAMQAWSKLVTSDGEIIITDFHPKLLSFGGKRTFKHKNKRLSVQNFVHSITNIKSILKEYGFRIVAEEELIIDETMKHYYAGQHALPVYEQFKGFPVIYGIHLRRGNDPE